MNTFYKEIKALTYECWETAKKLDIFVNFSGRKMPDKKFTEEVSESIHKIRMEIYRIEELSEFYKTKTKKQGGIKCCH